MNCPPRFVLPLLIIAAPLAGLAFAEEEKQATPDSDLIRGAWRVIDAQDEGREKPKILGQIDLFDTSRLHCISPNGRRMIYRYELDPTANPKRMLLLTDDELISTTAIYKLDGNTLTLCYSFRAGEIPKDFKTKLNDGRISLVLKRDKDR